MSRECPTLVVMFVMWSSTFVSSEECERRELPAKFTVTCNSPPFSRELDYCIPGQKINEPCSSDNVCGYCPDGQYQHVYTNCKTCIPCTTLGNCSNGQVLIRECQSASNAVCGCPRCPEVRCPTQPAVTCPPVPNTTCAPCLPCPTEPDVTTTAENTCPPCSTTEEKNPTSPSDDKPFTCPPVEPCPTPGTGSLVSNSELVHKGWKIWGIIAIVLVSVLLLACVALYHRKRPIHLPLKNDDEDLEADNKNGITDGGNHHRGRNGSNPPDPKEDNGGDSKEDNGGEPEEDDSHKQFVDLPSNNDCSGGVDTPDVTVNTPLRANESNPPGAEGSVQKSEKVELQIMTTNSREGKMLEFAGKELGEEMIQDWELDAIAHRVYDRHWGHSVTSLDSFFTRLRLGSKDYEKHLLDAKGEHVSNQIFHVLRRCQQEKPRSRNHYRKYLKEIDEDLSNYLVQIVNKEYASEDTASELDLFHQTGGNGQTSQSEDLGIVIHS